MHVLLLSIVSDCIMLQSPLHDDGISLVYRLTTVPLGKLPEGALSLTHDEIGQQ
jgi:hypothetical protein